jgi:S1-C subfamily serine protease
MTKAETARVVDATVCLPVKGGQGVLVAGGFILTAAHCISLDGRGKMTLGDYFLENVTTKSGVRFRVGPVSADPVSDIAVLAALDDQVFFKDADAFEQWSETTSPVPLASTTPRFRRPLPVSVLTHKGKWIAAKIIRYGPGRLNGGRLCIEAEDRIEGGTSGGPVVDSSGRLVGVVSWSSEVPAGQETAGALPIAHLTLPQWTLLSIRAAERSRTANVQARQNGGSR